MDRFRRQLRIRRLEDRTAPATFTVMNLNDSGADSLRACINSANTTVGADTIAFKAGLAGIITLISGELVVNSNSALAIQGPGAPSLWISGNNSSRIFNISNPAAGTAINISGLTLLEGKATGGGAAIFGDDQKLTLTNCSVTFNQSSSAVAMTSVGTIVATDCNLSQNTLGALSCNGGKVTLTRCTVSGNSNGGGVVVRYGGTLNATDCEFSGNNTNTVGGAISVGTDLFAPNGSATLTRCAIFGNSAPSGGGLFVEADLLMEGCTVSGNTSTGSFGGANRGGGLRLSNYYDASAVFTIRNSTISGNSSSRGGGIYLRPFNTTLNVQNSTITGNTAGRGGGIYNYSLFSGTIALSSSIVSGNTATLASDVYSSGCTVTMNSSAVGSNEGFTMTDLGGNLPFQPHANLKLGPLANNGGPTQTHTLALTSPCLDKGNNSLGLTTDQRGGGFPRLFGAGVDIGAVENSSQVVTNLNDSGAGSLRQAVVNANAKSGLDTIDFAPGLTGTITLTSGEISISESLTIIGPGASVVTISGNKASRIFNISGVTGPATGAFVSVSGLTLTNGAVSGTSGFGGAIVGVDETLQINNCVFTGNSATGAGGAISIGPGGNLTATNSSFTGNSSGNSGGAFFVGGTSGSVSMTACTVSGNKAPTAGGVYAQSALFLLDCTVAGNSAIGGLGGGISTGTLAGVTRIIRNSTITGNSAAFGGGIAFVNSNGDLLIQNSTVTANTSSGTGGGGVARLNGPGSISLESSVVSGNVNAAAPDISSTGTVNVKTSAIGSALGFTMTNLGGNLAFGTNLKLGPPQNNGGPTLTHVPAFDSPLIDVGSNPTALTTDQRGTGFPRVIGTSIDIGAVECVNLVVSNTNDSGAGSLRQTILHANSHAGPDTITFDPSFFNIPRTIALSFGQMSILEGVTINAPPSPVTINAQLLSRIFLVDSKTSGDLVSINGLTLTNGKATSVYGGDSGGGIANVDAQLSLNRVTVTNCSASYLGGGIGNFSIHGLALSDCNISGNSSALGGGGVYSSRGGLAITNSSVSDNKAGGNGGGIYAVGSAGTPFGFTIANSTISGNSTSNAPGGGIGLYFNGTAAIQNSTITGNSSGTANGAGINLIGGTATVNVNSSIVAGNLTSGTGADLSFNAATNVAGNNNLIGVADSGNFTLTGTGNLTGTKAAPLDAKLVPLANNGGPTQTHALLAGSPAINNGANPAGLANDQRGPGFARSIGQTDIGAFEVQTAAAPAKVSNVQINDGSSQRSRVTSVTIVFDTAVTFTGAVASAFSLDRQGGGAIGGFSSTATNVGGHTEVTLSNFTGAESQFGSLADGRYTLTVFASQIPGLDGNGDGTPGDNFVLIGTPVNGLFRLFGDADGDADVDTGDFGAFRSVFGGSSLTFDFDNDGDVDTSDFGAFRQRFGASV